MWKYLGHLHFGRRTDPEGFPALPLNGGAGAQSGGRGDKALLEVCVRARVWLFAVSLCATADYVADVTTKTPSLSPRDGEGKAGEPACFFEFRCTARF